MAKQVLCAGLLLVLSGCDCSGEVPADCGGDGDCDVGSVCRDGRCVVGVDAGERDAGDVPGVDGGPGLVDAGRCGAGELECGVSSCCGAGEICRFDACVSDFGPCTTNDECGGDSYCVEGRCVPYGVPADRVNDTACERAIDIEAITPEVQCRWTGEGDDPSYQVMATPVVVDLDLDSDPATLAPSIVFATFSTALGYGGPGVLRVIDGATCAPQFSFPAAEDAVMAPAGPALGDLDGDGRAEIVANGNGGGVKAFRFDGTTFARIWTSGVCDGAGGRTADSTGGGNRWEGPSIHDLDDDGVPEIVYGGVVYDNAGCIITQSLGYVTYSVGLVPVIADVDEDGRMEFITGASVYEFDPVARDWVAETWVTGGSLGQVAVADLGAFPIAALGGADGPEVAVITAGTGRVQTLDGVTVFGPIAIPGGGNGGAPTVADFDGDGRREFASAGGGNYVVFDLDCVAGGSVGTCASGRTDGILWAQASQDNSSNVTGSSVFDFDADGAAEAVYADECYLRIYDGATGAVLFSAARSSGTTYENPVIADVDGDFHSEIVSAVNDYAGTLGCPATDPLRPSATFETNHGIVVLRDELDRWAASRPVWNQHAYAVTHVGDRGEIPRTSAVAVNWRDPALNNFRQNVQGELDALGLADLTAASQTGPLMVSCTEEMVATLPARICNRGTLPLAAGTNIAFRVGAQDGPELCRAPVPVALTVGMCTEVTCTGTLTAESTDLYVIVDPDGEEEECWEGNNFALLSDVRCIILD